MSANARQRSEEFLKISGQFKLGALTTESSHPVTANLSEVAKSDIVAALKLLFEVDGDVVRKYREFVDSGRAGGIAEKIVGSLKNGGRIFFTGCGATGRLSILLDSIWRNFWHQRNNSDFENRTFSIMAGGDYALIKSVEGFEDFTAFGRKQMTDLGVSAKDIVFAITEGGETSFVIGTAWAGIEAGAKVYFVYNNPDEILCKHVERSREIIQDSRIEKINLTTGPMAITGSTRMQATSIQLCVMLTILETAARELCRTGILPVSNQKGAQSETENGDRRDACPTQFLAALEKLHTGLKSPEFLAQLAKLVALEESVYRAGCKCNYFANHFAVDVLTDTTERSPTFCTPPFRKFDDANATKSWAFLFLPDAATPAAWRNLLKREVRCVEWNENEIRMLVEANKFERTIEVVRNISEQELMRFKIGQDGRPFRPLNEGDGSIAIIADSETEAFDTFARDRLEAAQKAGVQTALIYFGSSGRQSAPSDNRSRLTSAATVFVPVPQTDLLLNGLTRVAVKLVLNALSTCTMVRLGRVMGNFMIYVVPTNLKLIDRATRYIAQLTGQTYEAANALLFEVIEYVEPRMKSDQSYPPVVGMAVLRARKNLTNEEAQAELSGQIVMRLESRQDAD
jgi:N-acetylmuramic acid 6-phosphate etherase